jgi:O-antigen ligase
MAIARQDISGTNASTFAFLSNLYVSSQSFLAHPMTGVGMGGYAMAYDKYIGGVEEADLNELLSMSLNRDDANSLFLRTAAELGLPGILVLLGFIILCAQVRGSPYQEIRNAILPYFLVRFGRYGAYFSVEVYFFVGIYLLNYLESRRANRLPASVSP